MARRHRTAPDPADTRTAAEQLAAGDWCRFDAELTAELAHARKLQDGYNAAPADADALRRRFLEALVGSLGEGVELRPPLQVDLGRNLHVGDGVFANYGLTALDCAPITIGAGTQLGPNVQLLTPDHPRDPELRAAGWEAADPIVIGTNVWIGGGAIVLGGVTIGDDAIVGAGAVVTRDVPAGATVVSTPARVVTSG